MPWQGTMRRQLTGDAAVVEMAGLATGPVLLVTGRHRPPLVDVRAPALLVAERALCYHRNGLVR